MAAPNWILGTAATQAPADRSLHAGACVDHMRGNLLRCIQESAYDIQGFHNDGDLAISEAFLTANGFDLFSDWNQFPVPVRFNPGTTLRTYNISLEAMISTTGTATIRAYLRPSWWYSAGVDDTDGYIDETWYTELEVTAESWGTVYNGTVTVSEAGELFRGEEPRHPATYLALLCSTDVDMTVSVRAPRVREIVTV